MYHRSNVSVTYIFLRFQKFLLSFSGMGYRILAVGDDDCCERVRAVCAAADFDLQCVRSGAEAIIELADSLRHLVLVDLHLPDVHGASWLKVLRAHEPGAAVGLVALTSSRSDAEMAESFEAGADDYVERGLSADELGARARAVLRRRFERDERLGPPLELWPLSVAPLTGEVRLRERPLEMNRREAQLLEVLMRHAGRTLSRAWLLEAVWGGLPDETRAVDVGISRLRRRLGPRAARRIETVDGAGYRFTPSP